MRLALARILADRALAYRDGLERWAGAARLRASILRRGVLEPVTLAAPAGADEGLLLVAGHRRVEVLREIGASDVPARVLDGPLPDLFVQAVERHAGQPANPREVARALRIGGELGLGPEQAAARLLPAFGLEPHPELARRYLDLLQVPDVLLDLFVDKGFSLRRCLPFCRLTADEAEIVAALVQGGLIRGGRQLEQATTWLVETAAREEGTVPGLARELGLLDRPAPDDALARLEARRLPEVTRRRGELDTLCAEVAPGVVQVRYDRNFTGDRVELSVSVASVDELREAVARLSETVAEQRVAAIIARATGREP